MTPSNLKPTCTETDRQISAADLPLCCPMKDNELWNGHPRVYLPIDTTGEITCPYCGTHYTLQG